MTRCLNYQRRDWCSHNSQAHWNPYVAHVDEWLNEAAEPDEETDSWVARTALRMLFVSSETAWTTSALLQDGARDLRGVQRRE